MSRKITAEYIVGLVDGEGCFSNSGKYPRFCISNTNKYILDLMQRFLELGIQPFLKKRYEINPTIYRNKPPLPVFRLNVASFQDIKKLVEFFNKHPPIIKSDDFLRFKERFIEWEKTYSPPRKYSDETINMVRELYLEGYKYKTIARKTGVSEGGVSYHVKDIRNRNKSWKRKDGINHVSRE